MQAFSGPIAILVDAVTFVVSALFLGSIKHAELQPVAPAVRTSVYREWRDGLRHVGRDPILRSLAIVGVMFSLGFGLFGATYSLFVLRDLDFAPGWLGVIYGIGGLSSLAGAMLAARASDRLGLGPSLVVGLLMMGMAMLLVPLATGAAGVVALFLIASQLGDGGFTTFDVNSMSLRQSITRDEMLGRVNAFMRMSEIALIFGGTLLVGVLATTIGLRPTLVLGAAAVIAAAAYMAASPLARVRAAPAIVEEVAPEPASP